MEKQILCATKSSIVLLIVLVAFANPSMTFRFSGNHENVVEEYEHLPITSGERKSQAGLSSINNKLT